MFSVEVWVNVDSAACMHARLQRMLNLCMYVVMLVVPCDCFQDEPESEEIAIASFTPCPWTMDIIVAGQDKEKFIGVYVYVHMRVCLYTYTISHFIFVVKNFRMRKMHKNYFHKYNYTTYMYISRSTVVFLIHYDKRDS